MLLDFWATWCGPCKEELPIIEKLYEEFKGKGLVALGINEEDRGTVERFVKNEGLTFPILIDERGEVSKKFRVVAIPRVILVNKEGIVVKDILGYSPRNEKILREAIKKSLKD